MAKRALTERGVETIRFLNHVDSDKKWSSFSNCSFAFIKDEMLSVRTTHRLSCPPTPVSQWAWGWNASQKGRCECEATRRTKPVVENGRERKFPYWHVLCKKRDAQLGGAPTVCSRDSRGACLQERQRYHMPIPSD